MSGILSTKDAATLRQSTRIDSHWTFFKRQLQIQHALLARKLIVCELGAGTGDLAQLAQGVPGIKEYICIEGSDLVNSIRQRKLPHTRIIHRDAEKIRLPGVDAILAKYFFHHIADKKALFEKTYNALPKNGSLIVIDRFPRFGAISLALEKAWNVLGIKKQLGTHYYISQKEFIAMAEKTGFDVEYKLTKKPNKIKNFFIVKGFYVLRKV